MVKKAKERAERLHRMKRAKEEGSYRSSTLMALIPRRRKHNIYMKNNESTGRCNMKF
jgi:hypothetical protein